MYVDELIGPDTVNTMPDATVEAARDHATAQRTVDKDLAGAHAHMDALRELGIDVDRVVGVDLVEEGVASFAKSFDSMISTIAEKARSVAAG
jgi:transaldolase